MNIRILLLVIISFWSIFSQSVWAQPQAEVNYSEKQFSEKNFVIRLKLGEYYYATELEQEPTDENSLKELRLYRLNDAMEVVQEKRWAGVQTERRLVFDYLKQIGEKLMLFYSLVDIKAGKISNYCRELDPMTLEEKAEPFLLLTENLEKSPFKKQNWKRKEWFMEDAANEFGIVQSPDRSKFAFVNIPDEQKALSIQVYDAELTPIWTLDYALGKQDSNLLLPALSLDNRGELYLIEGRYRLEALAGDTRKKPTRELLIDYQVRHDRKGKAPETFRLSQQGEGLYRLQFHAADDGSLHVYGFTQPRQQNRFINTIYKKTYKKRADFKLESVYHLAVNKENLSQSEEQLISIGEKLGPTGSHRVELNHIFDLEDGGCMLVGEFRPYYEFKTQYNDIVMASADIVILRMSKAGKVVWTRRVPKMQINKVDWFDHYAVSLSDYGLEFIFNDNPANLNGVRPPYPKLFVSTRINVKVAWVSIGWDGAVFNRELPGIEGNAPMLATLKGRNRFFVQDHALLFAAHGRRKRLVRVAFE